MTILEGVLARGDRKVADVLLAAYEKGALFDAWSEYFNYEYWKEAFAQTGIDPDFYTLRKREKEELFPWDFIDVQVAKSFLWKEWERSMAGEVTPNCRVQCSGCGASSLGGGVCIESKS